MGLVQGGVYSSLFTRLSNPPSLPPSLPHLDLAGLLDLLGLEAAETPGFSIFLGTKAVLGVGLAVLLLAALVVAVGEVLLGTKLEAVSPLLAASVADGVVGEAHRPVVGAVVPNGTELVVQLSERERSKVAETAERLWGERVHVVIADFHWAAAVVSVGLGWHVSSSVLPLLGFSVFSEPLYRDVLAAGPSLLPLAAGTLQAGVHLPEGVPVGVGSRLPVDENAGELDTVLPTCRDNNLADVLNLADICHLDASSLCLFEGLPYVEEVCRSLPVDAEELDGDLVVGSVVPPPSYDDLNRVLFRLVCSVDGRGGEGAADARDGSAARQPPLALLDVLCDLLLEVPLEPAMSER